jgi:uncharacterized membrane protein SpoIIM required for sporulation
MREVAFVNQNADKWKQFEHLLKNKDIHNPDEIATSYIQVIDDLSYARTFYPQSKTYSYLNELSARAHHTIYKNKKEKKNRLVTFWKYELPMLFYHSRKQFFIAFLVFILAALIGGVSAANDENFVRLILGDSYVNMTLENIKNGDPLGVYGSHDAFTMFFLIAINNIFVALRTFAAGLLLSVGTVLLIFYNGVMLGSFQYFFYKYGLLKVSLLTIWLHGTIEISVCIIAGCAGLVMGNSILFPGTYSRLESFKRGAKQGLKIVIGTVPFFLIAAFIESFITRHARASQAFDVVLISLSLILIIGYFIIYPYILNRKTQKPING